MDISNTPINRVHHIYRQKQMQKLEKPRDGEKAKDQVSLSSQARDLQNAVSYVKDTPEIRPEAEELKNAVRSGVYRPNNKAVARRLLTHPGGRIQG